MPSLLFEDEDINRAPETGYLPRYGRIPTEAPEGTYSGRLPTPNTDYAQNIMMFPPAYQKMLQLLKPEDPEAYKQLLKLIYANKWNREG